MFPSFRLVVKAGPNTGKGFPLEKNELFIGRDLSNDIVINDPEVSRRHARLVLQGVNFLLEDLGSTNGTFIRGQRLSGPYMLVPGDMVTLGERINLLFEVVPTAGAAQATPDHTAQGAPGVPPALEYPQGSPGGYSATQIEPPAARPAVPPAVPVQPPPQPIYQPAPPPQQQVYQPPPQPIYQQSPAQVFEPYQPQQPVQPPYSGQVPMHPQPVSQSKSIPVWMWVVVAVLLLVILVLVIDDFRLWYIFGIK